MEFLIFSKRITSRLNYTFRFVFGEVIGLDFAVCTDPAKFRSHAGPKISYHETPVADEPFIQSDLLLFEEGVKPQLPISTNYKDYRICFPVPNSIFPFDIFAAAFYLLTRYEEYLPHATDRHGRFAAENSFAFKNGFLHRPVIDEWAMELKKVLRASFPELKFRNREYIFQPTIDIDHAYAYRHSGFLKNSLRYALSLISGKLNSARKIRRVMSGQEKDPFDTYQLLKDFHPIDKAIQPIFFFLLSNRGGHDKGLSPKKRPFKNLVREIKRYALVGLHPSYASGSDFNLLRLEIKLLENITGEEAERSRQHYLLLNLPETYRNLISVGIKHDYSMGHASQAGFRASTCTPFLWYDLLKEEESGLIVHPFAVMDVTLKQYLQLSPEKALDLIKQLCDAVRGVNGTFCTLWHNESLSEEENWLSWRKLYRNMIEYASSQ